MTESLLDEYCEMEISYQKLVSEGRELKLEQRQDLKDFLRTDVSDKEWQKNLENTACYLASTNVRLQVAQKKIMQIKRLLVKRQKEND